MSHTSIEVYSVGLVYASVCAKADLPPEEVERLVNEVSPTGISSRWTISPEKFRTGEDNPHQCETHSDRKHYLMVC